MKRYVIVLLLLVLLVSCDDTGPVAGDDQQLANDPLGTTNETEGAVEDAVLNSNGTDVLTTQATFFANHTQTQVQQTKVVSIISIT